MSQGNSILPKWCFKLKSSALQPSLLEPSHTRAAVKVGGPARPVALSKREKPLRGKVIRWEELCSGLFFFFFFFSVSYLPSSVLIVHIYGLHCDNSTHIYNM